MSILSQEIVKFGVCAHNPSHGSCTGYPRRMTETHIRLTAELGAKIFRVDFEPGNTEWMDEVVDLCEKHGLELMAILYEANGKAESIARRYKGRIKYYQVLNEIDCGAFKKIPGQGDSDGLEISNFHENKLAEAAARCREIIAEIRRADPDVQICINGTWRHFGMIDYMLQNGVEFDVLGWDWYSNMEHYGIHKIIEDLLAYGKDVIFCEINIWPHTHTDADRAGFLTTWMKQIHDYPTDRIKGVIFYELLDEPCHPVESEGTFGLVRADENGNILGLKDAYTAIQELLL